MRCRVLAWRRAPVWMMALGRTSNRSAARGASTQTRQPHIRGRCPSSKRARGGQSGARQATCQFEPRAASSRRHWKGVPGHAGHRVTVKGRPSVFGRTAQRAAKFRRRGHPSEHGSASFLAVLTGRLRMLRPRMRRFHCLLVACAVATIACGAFTMEREVEASASKPTLKSSSRSRKRPCAFQRKWPRHSTRMSLKRWRRTISAILVFSPSAASFL